MRDDIQVWFWIIFFIVLPILQAVVRKVAAKKKPELERDVARRKAARVAAQRKEPEEEELPEWLDPALWEDVQADLEEIDPRTPERGRPRTAVPIPVGPQPPETPGGPRGAVIVPLPTLPEPRGRGIAPPSPPPPRRTSRPDLLPSLDSPLDPVKRRPRRTGHQSLRVGRSELRKAVLWAEVLGSPRSLRPHADPETAGD